MGLSGRTRGAIGAALSVALSLVVAVTLVVASQPDDDNAPRKTHRLIQAPPPPKVDSLAVAMVRLPPPPEPSPKPEIVPPKAQPAPIPPKAQPAPIKVTPLKPTAPPAPVQVAAPAKITVTPLKPVSRPAPIPDPATPKPPAVKINKSVAAEGRTLLRLLEHGKGPAIEIAWPSRAKERARLFAYLRGCLHMQVALMDGDRGFYLASGPAGSASDLNLDRFSGFMRRPSGDMSRAETRLIAAIRARHGKYRAVPVRLFPRRVDAALLGGLNMVVGKSYGAGKNIRARYRRDGRGLYVTDIRVDGRAVPGRILLSNRQCADSGV